MHYRGLTLLIAVVLVTLSGCGDREEPLKTQIGSIWADPRGFDAKVVTIEGKATKPVGAWSTGVFLVEDQTGTIPIVTTHILPKEGQQVKISGTVQQGLVAGRNYSLFILETPRRLEH